ncbi:MAG TPA: addiction module protein [Thermoanaerobaculia bacterium]|nr:addiction module protein [Thermoanaerobaculia bacterium]
MTNVELKREILRLPVEERMELAETIWDSLEQITEQPPLPAWQRQVLDERIEADDADPDAGSPWDEVKQRILASL